MKQLLSYQALAKETPAAKFIPYSHHITPTIISTKNAEYLSIWHVGGRSHQSASPDEIFRWIKELNNLLRGLAPTNIAFWSHVVRRKVYTHLQSEFSNSFCARLDEHYQDSFADQSLMVNDLYLTVILRSSSDDALSFFAGFEQETLEQKKQRQAASIKALDDINYTLAAALKRYNGSLLSTYDHQGHVYSAALEFLAFLVNGEHHRIPVCRDRFAEYICLNRVLFSTWGEIGEIRSIKDTRCFGMLEITDYDDTTEAGQLNALLESSYEFILSQSFATLSRHAAQGFLQRHKQRLIDAKDVAYQQIEEIDEALNQLVSGQFVMGEHHASLLVFGKDAEEVRDSFAKASTSFLDVGILAKTCDLSLQAAYFAQLPANFSYRPRPAPITSLNFLCFSPFHNFMSGKDCGNPWGQAVTMLKTVSGTPFYFNFHVSPQDEDSYDKRLLGNTMFIGKSGTGKTVALGFLLAQAQKFKPTIVAFDKDRGMEITLRAMGGCYLPLRKGEPSGFNPFQLEPTPANLSFLKQLIIKLASARGESVTHNDELEIDQALETLMLHIDKPLRRLSMLLQGLPNPVQNEQDARPKMHSRLAKWAEGGELGWLFDNVEDKLDLTTHRIYGFDVTEFLDDPVTRVPIIMYLTHRTESMIDGRRFMYVFDEFWRMLEDKYFESLAKDKQKTIRKQNGIFVFATQEPSDALESPIAKTLVQQCATFVFLPNPSADRQDYIEGFKLSEAEFEQIINLGEDSRRFLIKQGEGSTVAELNLAGFDDELLVLSGTPDNARLVETIIQRIGSDNPNDWLPIFLREARGQRS